jgi:hypothetical protein
MATLAPPDDFAQLMAGPDDVQVRTVAMAATDAAFLSRRFRWFFIHARSPGLGKEWP